MAKAGLLQSGAVGYALVAVPKSQGWGLADLHYAYVWTQENLVTRGNVN